LQAEYGMNGEKGRTGAAKRLWREFEKLCVYIDTWGAQPHKIVTVHPLHSQQRRYLSTSVGRFSLLCAPAGSGSYVMLWEPDRLRIYICVCVCVCFFELVRTDRVFKIFIFSKVICFSNMVILAYTITIDFPIWFSELSFHSFWKLIV
jgi:hypothetical protein